MTTDKPDCASMVTALVLAGGRSRRMRGEDKGLVNVGDKPLVGYVLERITPQVSHTLISANRNGESYANLCFRVLADNFDKEEYAGPMAGILAGINACETPYLLSVPCDTPCLPTDIVKRMYETIEADGVDIVTVHDGQRLQPIIMLMRVANMGGLQAWLEKGERAVQDWIGQHSHSVVHDNEPAAYRNLNTDTDLAEFAQTLCK